MPITIGSNIAALATQRRLGDADGRLHTVFERLSSGLRINRPSDDAAGLAISESLRADSRVYSQGIRNINDGLSTLAIADGALAELSTILTRQAELAEQAANGVYSFSQRSALHKEAEALTDEFNRIVESTEFNGRKLFESVGEELRIQAGYGLSGSIGFGIGSDLARTVGDGTFQTGVAYTSGAGAYDVKAADINGDGKLDLLAAEQNSNKLAVLLGNGDGSFQSRVTYAMGLAPTELELADFNEDGILDVATANITSNSISIRLGNSNGTFQANTNFSTGVGPLSMVVGDFNGDGHIDIANTNANAASDSIGIFLGRGDGTFQVGVTIDATGTASPEQDISVGDINNDGILDLFTTGVDKESVWLGHGDGTFQTAKVSSISPSSRSAALADFDLDGRLDVAVTDTLNEKIYLAFGNGDGTFGPKTTYNAATNPFLIRPQDLNGDGYADLVSGHYGSGTVSVLLNDGTGNFSTSATFSNGADQRLPGFGDFNGDGAIDIASTNLGGGTIYINLANTQAYSKMEHFSLYNQADARDAMSVIRDTLSRIAAERGAIGAVQSRLGVAATALSVGRENFEAAASQIRDADIAAESAELAKTRILQQAGTAVLAQANQLPALALKLL